MPLPSLDSLQLLEFSCRSPQWISDVFRNVGARREMMIGFLAEPASNGVFNAFILFGSTSLPSLVDGYRAHPAVIDPSVIFAAIAFAMVLWPRTAAFRSIIQYPSRTDNDPRSDAPLNIPRGILPCRVGIEFETIQL